MWIKITGSLFVLISGTFIGFKIASHFSERPSQIRQILSCLTSLKSYVNYVSMPLSEALLSCTKGVDGPIKNLFHKMAHLLEENGCFTPQEAIQYALKDCENELSLEKAEIELLHALGSNLGFINSDEQERYISMIQVQLKEIEREAVHYRDQNVKMYRYLGICSALVIVIILL
jgi:stage III sporulation protein AB